MNPSAAPNMLTQLWFIAIAVLAIAVLYLAKVLLLPLGIAILFAFLLAPVVGILERFRLPRPVAALCVILAFAALLLVATWTLFTQFVAIANDLPTYSGNIAQKMQALHSPSNSAYSRAQSEIQHISEELGIANSTGAIPSEERAEATPIGASPEHPMHVREVGRPTGRLDQLGGIVEPLTTALLAVVFTFFVLLQREDLRNRLIRLTGDHNLSRMTQAMGDASRRISRYFLLQVTINVAFGALVYVALSVIGLPHAGFFASLAILCRFVPYIGTPVAALTPTFLSLAVFPGWEHSAEIFGFFLVLEIITGNYVEPRVYGKHTGLSSLAVLIAAVFWTLIWGPVGLFLSIPLTVCLIVMGSHIPSLEFLAVLLGDRPVIPPYTRFFQRMLAHDEREAANILQSSLRSESLALVYDSILIPALTLVETERQRGELDEHTVRFIRKSASEMVDELGFRAQEEKNGRAPGETDFANSTHAAHMQTARIQVIPVRDGADDLISTMLAQVLNEAGFDAECIPVQSIDETVSAITMRKPDMVFLSGMPPVAMARANRIFRGLRSADPALKIAMGIWHYNEDPVTAAQMISRAEELPICTSLADALVAARVHPAPNPAVPEPLDESPELVAVPSDTAA
ncbi:MAG: AI-2E family transporter [Terracidiphilus sp.]